MTGPARPTGPRVVYVSPLRALAVDVHENLQRPLAGIAEEATRLGLCDRPTSRLQSGPEIPLLPNGRQCARSPPDLLVTTPESLYLLLTAASSRVTLQHVHTVIVDEVHTLARDKRGAHLALSLERLIVSPRSQGPGSNASGCRRPSARSRWWPSCCPGTDPAGPPTTIVDCGHRRDLDVDIELPQSSSRR